MDFSYFRNKDKVVHRWVRAGRWVPKRHIKHWAKQQKCRSRKEGSKSKLLTAVYVCKVIAYKSCGELSLSAKCPIGQAQNCNFKKVTIRNIGNSHTARQCFMCHGYNRNNGETWRIELPITYSTFSTLTQWRASRSLKISNLIILLNTVNIHSSKSEKVSWL